MKDHQADGIKKIIFSASDPFYLKDQFLQRLSQGKLTRDENPSSHFCAFFAPFDPVCQQVFLGHHKKGNRWLFNGGHLDQGEPPLKTIKREMLEEWGDQANHPIICKQRLITITHITDPAQTCKTHYDLWFFLSVDKNSFQPNEELMKKEFHSWGWKTKKEALALCHEKGPDITKALEIIFKELIKI